MSALKGRGSALAAVITATALLTACTAPQPIVSHAPGRATPVPVAAPLSPRVPGLKDLAGLHPADIVALLGQPDLRRDEPPAELWQYRAADCVLTLFFYREPGGYRLARAETWQRNFAGNPASMHCRDENAPVRAHLVATQSSL